MREFRNGDKVVCINPLVGYTTQGKTYEVIKPLPEACRIEIIDDKGRVCHARADRFVIAYDYIKKSPFTCYIKQFPRRYGYGVEASFVPFTNLRKAEHWDELGEDEKQFQVIDMASVTSLFDKIKHGDKEHQDWLENAINEHFGLKK